MKNRILCLVVPLLLAVLPTSSAFAPTDSISRNRIKVHSSSSRLQTFASIDDIATLATSTQPLIDGNYFSSVLSSSSLDISDGLLSTENIKVAFSIATFFPQLPWLFLILLPNTGVTKKLLGGYGA